MLEERCALTFQIKCGHQYSACTKGASAVAVLNEASAVAVFEVTLAFTLELCRQKRHKPRTPQNGGC